MNISGGLCVRCKGRNWCGLSNCPILAKHFSFKGMKEGLSKAEFEGPSPPTVFVGRHSYPNVFVAPLSTPTAPEDASLLDDPNRWYGTSLDKIVEYRSVLVRSNMRVAAKKAQSPSGFLVDLQDVAMAKRPVDLDVELKDRPKLELSFSPGSAPFGPTGLMKKFDLAENPVIPRKIDKVTSDTDLRATEAMIYLYDHGFTETKIHNILSIGALGRGSARRLVPTRWSITAVDDTVSKHMLDDIRHYPLISEYRLFHSKYLDNNFYVILFPLPWAFEQMEAWKPGSAWHLGKEIVIMSDAELGRDRKTYANNVGGAYYAARLAVCEYLKDRKEQAAALILREIGEEYRVGVGVWQIRENVRHALMKRPLVFDTLGLLFRYLGGKFKIPSKEWKRQSQLLSFFRTQKRLTDFFSPS